ncbi:iron-containing redox enzyme family protein [Streptomyces alkaliterrae]|uniref:Iron-containing redox enzyme family protein n=1 Tax=Streptomyces alkaliterrae TaxID=2213162 RepID=A0A5P0YXT0_9ACTN|nr:iron-containing redox enzyme family protein [Streptomyces alkaliterrae]MBB1253722.1 iron-containing redox enzyme family protein [Streptomyces alkaliterrae]MBB1257982.1 iron-containing redox enzyme family protein [Streptomyces alkaliterrae]MQS04322.1 iron-containing redox enzyme family protein [Streptomyces alkaliterrae]
MHGPAVAFPTTAESRPEPSLARRLYVRALDPECRLPSGALVDELRSELGRFRNAGQRPSDLAALREAATRWASQETARFVGLLDRAAGDPDREAVVRQAGLSAAPLALLSGAWLQWLSAPGNADDPPTLRVLGLYAADLGAGHPHASRGSAYLTVLRSLLLAEYATPPARLAQDQRVDDGSFYLPSVLLALSRRPDEFREELVGADHCLRTVGLLPVLALVRAAHPHTTRWESVDPSGVRQGGEGSGVELSLAAVGALLDTSSPERTPRLVAGFGWAMEALRGWHTSLYDRLESCLDPAYGMGELMRLRAREGAVYHHDFAMEGRSLSAWLTECRTDPAPFLGVLARSRMVKPGRSEASSLVNGLVGERGPMFRVFAPEDLAVVRRWIDSLPPRDAHAAERRPQPVVPPFAVPRLSWPTTAAEPEGSAPEDLRDAYWRLQGRTTSPAVHRWAREYVHGWLARSRHGIGRDGTTLPEHWPAEGLRPWLAAEHDRHGEEFERGNATEVPTREELVDSTVQLAPLTLIDGSWLQGFTDYTEASSEIGFSLFETYWDELGNGEPRLNHPLIYREVLAEMSVELPPTASREFARWSGFRDGSFELPVYWLAIGRFPRTFLPEVLGLNLAMELSGVGGSYRRARIALREHGFSTRFVDIHNTIDNVSSGHSAWAADAVDTYLSTVPASHLAQVWHRVRTGYRSLNPPSGLWARQAQRRARGSRTGKRFTR